MKRILLAGLLLISTSIMAGLPPTTSKGAGDTSNKGTTNFQFPTLPVTHTGATAVFGGPMTTAQRIAYGATLTAGNDGVSVYDTDLKATATWNGTSWQWGFGNIKLDDTYSAVSSAAGVLSGLNKAGWISFTSITDTSLFNFSLTGFTLAPNCTPSIITNDPTAAYTSVITSVTSSSLSVRIGYSDAATNFTKAPNVFSIICQKSGADYAYASASVFATSNANTDWAACTFPDLTSTSWGGLATTGTITNNLFCKRDNGSLRIRGKFTTGTVSAAAPKIPLPTNWGALTISSSISTSSYIGIMFRNINSSANISYAILASPSGAFLQISNTIISTANNPSVAMTAASAGIGSTETEDVGEISIPIAGWANSNLIVGSFAGYAKVPGADVSATPNVDHFKFSFGATINTPCTTGTCAYLNQIGTAVSSIVKTASAGNYTVNTPMTYTNLKCTGSIITAALYGVAIGQCSNCNNLNLVTASAGAAADSNGIIDCIGSY